MVDLHESDWLIEQAEAEIAEIVNELKLRQLSIAEKTKLRGVLATLMGTLQKLYVQRNLVKPSKEVLDETLARIPDKEAKKALKELIRVGG